MDYLYVLQSIREASPDLVNYIFVFISEILPKIFLVAGAVIFWSVNKKEGAAILLGYSVAYGVNQTIKNIACIYRPWILDSRLHVADQAVKSATGYSFPSGHTVTAASLCGGVAVWLKKKISVIILMIICIIFVAFSRNWLGAHTMKDVLTAILVGGVTLIIVNLLKYYVTYKPKKDSVIMISGLVIAGVITLILQLKNYPMDYDSEGNLLCDPFYMLTDCYTALGLVAGGLFGWWLERRTVKFTTEGTRKKLIIRAVIGVVSFGIIYFGAGLIFSAIEKQYLPMRNPGHMLKSFIAFFYIFYVYPLIFKLIEKKLNRKES